MADEWQDINPSEWEDIQQPNPFKNFLRKAGFIGPESASLAGKTPQEIQAGLTQQNAPGKTNLPQPTGWDIPGAAGRAVGNIAAPFSLPAAGSVIGAGLSPEGSIIGPLAGAAVGGGIKAGMGLLGAPWTRPSRIAQAAQGMGRATNPAERLAEAGQPITEAYNRALSVEAGVPNGGIVAAGRRAISETPMAEEAVHEILKIESSDLVGNAPNGIARYKDVVRAVQGMPTDLWDDETNAAMSRFREAMVNATKSVNPALADANALTAHTTASDKVLRAVTASKNTEAATIAVDQLFSKDKQTVKALGLSNPAAMEQFRNLISRGATPDMIKKWLARVASITGHAAAYGAVGYGAARMLGYGGGGEPH